MAPQEKIKTTSKPIPMRAMKTPMKQADKTVKTPLKLVTNTLSTRQRTASAPKTPKPTGPVTPAKPSAPSWKRRPPAAHSGVPVPEKMRKLFDKIRREKQAAAENAVATSAPN